MLHFVCLFRTWTCFMINLINFVFISLLYANCLNLNWIFAPLISLSKNTSTPARPESSKSKEVFYFSDQSDSLLKSDFALRIVHEIFRQLSKVFHIFSAFLFVFGNIFIRILFNDCQSFLCAILFEVL